MPILRATLFIRDNLGNEVSRKIESKLIENHGYDDDLKFRFINYFREILAPTHKVDFGPISIKKDG